MLKLKLLTAKCYFNSSNAVSIMAGVHKWPPPWVQPFSTHGSNGGSHLDLVLPHVRPGTRNEAFCVIPFQK